MKKGATPPRTAAGREDMRRFLRSSADWYSLGMKEILLVDWDQYAQYGVEIERDRERERLIDLEIKRARQDREAQP